MMEEIDLKELIKIFWKKKFLIIIITTLFIVLGFAKCVIFDDILNKEEQKYSVAEMNIVVTSGEITSSVNHIINKKNDPELYSINSEETHSFSEDLYKTYLNILKSNSIIDPVIKEYNLNITTSEFANHITLLKTTGSDYIKIIVALNNDKILDITNSLCNEFINCIKKTYSLENNITIIDNAYLLTNIDIESLKTSVTTTDIVKFDKFIDSIYPTFNVNNILFKNLTIFTFIGLILSCGYILIVESFDETIKNEQDIKNLKLSVLLNKTKNIDNINILNGKLNNYNTISHINYTHDINESAYNLALNYAKQSKKVIYISLIKNENIISNKGLYDYMLNQDVTKDGSKSTVQNYLANSNNNYLDILSCGNINKDYIFNENYIDKMLSELQNKYDYIIVDLDDIQKDVNSLLMLKNIKNTYISCKIRKTNIQTLNNIINDTKESNINILGTLLIN